VRFPRDEISELLETGGEVRVTVTGTTEDDVVVSGNDEIRIIEPRQSSGPGDEEGSGPPGGSQGGGLVVTQAADPTDTLGTRALYSSN